MTDEACPMPTPPTPREAQAVSRILSARRIAVVGVSAKPDRPSHYVAKYLQSNGYEVLPVNPTLTEVLGVKCHNSLAEIAGQFDVVDIFRRSEACPEVVREAIAAGAKGVWLQSGIISDESRKLASDAGIDYVEDRCMMVSHMHR